MLTSRPGREAAVTVARGRASGPGRGTHGVLSVSWSRLCQKAVPEMGTLPFPAVLP